MRARSLPSVKILSYNIHKGLSSFSTKYVLEGIRNSIRETKADILCLQEVMGSHGENIQSQFEFLADAEWPHFAYGKNATYSKGNHGNAILSKFPILFSENINISTNRLEKRGVLHAIIELEKNQIHVLCTHLNLLEKSRKLQVARLGKIIQERVPEKSPFVLAGDFNDWRETVSEELLKILEIEEAYFQIHGTHSATYPSWLPKLRIDRLYFRGLTAKKVHFFAEKKWKKLSDHLPVMAELDCS